jgi:hypothetical protein
MNEIKQKLYQLTDKYKLPSKHSDFQIENFIVGKEVDVNGKIWQCLREISARKDSLEAVELEIQQINDNIELNDIKKQKLLLKTIKNNNIKQLNEKERQIKLNGYKRNEITFINTLNKLVEKKEGILSETKKFVEIFENLIELNGYKDFDNDEAQINYWNNKFGYELDVNNLLGYNLNPDLVKSIMALPKNSKLKISLENTIKERQKILLQKNN